MSPTFQINSRAILSINRERAGRDRQVRYIKCPECGILMNRVNFSYRSGVVMDQCREHGVWLDNGEITHLMEWKKAGGQLLAEQKKQLQDRPGNRQQRGAGASVSGWGEASPQENTEINFADDLLSRAISLFQSPRMNRSRGSTRYPYPIRFLSKRRTSGLAKSG